MLNEDHIKKRISSDDFYWSKHSMDKCDQYGYDIDIIKEEIVKQGELIEGLYRYGYGSKYLLYVNSRVNGEYHVAIVHEFGMQNVKITTIYKPDSRFKVDNKTRVDSGGLF